MSWMLIRHEAPYPDSAIPSLWIFAPQLGPNLNMEPIYNDPDPVYFGQQLCSIESSTLDHVEFRAKFYAGPDGTHYVMSLNPPRADITPEIRAALYDLLGLKEIS